MRLNDAGAVAEQDGAKIRVMGDLGLFSRVVLGKPLYAYQLAAARAVLASVVAGRGDEFLLVMARQSGKNETVSQLLCYLLNLLRRTGGTIVYAAIGDNIGRGIRRLEGHLDNAWNGEAWKRRGRPERYTLGKASVVFLSSHPQAHARGETAQPLLVVDELQDQDAAHVQAVLQPMRAAYNATAVYLGTVRTTYDALWLKKEALEGLQAQDGIQRVFMVGPEQVMAENGQYARFLAGQIAQLGRAHPLIASEYFLEPLDREAGLFGRRRLQLMRGEHGREAGRAEAGGRDVYVATLDVAGIDEAPTEPAAAISGPAALGNGARDYTTCTIFRVDEGGAAGPVFRAVDVFTDQGSQHFREQADGTPSLARQLLAYLAHWGVAHVVGDATGVGEGLLNWLAAMLGAAHVTPFRFTRRSKAQLGVDFLALVETNRFKYWREGHEFDDAWWFFAQAARCAVVLEAGRPLQTHLQWFVPATARVSAPQGKVAVHDDRLVSAALVAEVDRLIRVGVIRMGRAESAVIAGRDPIDDLPAW